MVLVQTFLNCFCEHVRPFDPKIEFIILTHPIEVQRRIATGRMSHLCLERSRLIVGDNFSEHVLVNQLISDPTNQALMLFPGKDAINLSTLQGAQRSAPFTSDKKLVVFVIDGTWATARNMVRHSKNLSALPRICFSLDTPSTFRVRKQPAAGCYSTIEAIHQVIELVGSLYGFSIDARRHDNLLQVFDKMVEQQLRFIPEHVAIRRGSGSNSV